MKTTLKLATAVAFALSGTAYAAPITLGDAGLANVNTYAAELDFTAAAVAAAAEIETPLGFGVSDGQTRFARFDLTGGNFDVAVVSANFNDNTSAFIDVTLVSGGAAESTCAVFQVTGNAGGHTSADIVSFDFPDLNITDAAGVSATYSLHETALSASCTGGTQTTILSPAVTGPLVNTANALVFTGANGTTVTSSVDALFVTEIDAVNSTSILTLGTLTTDITGALEADNSAVDQADLIVNDTTITINGDFSAIGTADPVVGSVTLATTCDPLAGQIGAAATIAADLQSAVFTITLDDFFADAAAAVEAEVCYNVDGVTPIAAGTYTATLAPTAVAGATLPATAGVDAGVVVRDGTVLRAPFVQALAGTSTFFNLANSGTVDAPYTVTCFSATAGNASAAGTPGTVAAGASTRIGFGAVGCPGGMNYNAVDFTLAVPTGNVVGSVIRENADGSTGFSDMTGNQ